MEVNQENLDPFLLPSFTLIFISIYLLGYTTLFRNWDSKQRPEASSCLISLAHGTPAVLLSIYATFLHQQPPHHHHFAAKNIPFQTLVLDFSIAYFFTDTSHYFIFIPNDHLFIAHHLAVLYVFITCRFVVGSGGSAVLLLLMLAEVTSPCQNAWSLARFRKDDVASAARFYGGLSPYFYGFYTVVRGVVGPLVVHKMVVFYLNGGGSGKIPVWAWVSWMVVIVNAILVSVLWVSNLWLNLFKERSKIRKLS
ncbi:TLC domain-containing protein At5g14285-like [Cynara cardunculus var. scolymus]|uniref:TRAM/LAG1/CLN8 homology domain-containing protein n=1 Tax=Cynara cardunculus var. scolymus TaxID=59895 RepID=A0A118K3D7_CYNCS|nr:TLC domain-containing protein At5g14285-like [Cynara cardunculus var. scolymus]KVI05760.1 TRAM/LAG1/CLN8 homology domain-containing protein [Cynara cardunculus var. scolymus]